MIDLGTVRPGTTIRIPFSSFDKDDGSSITMTNFAVGDILVYKDGGTTERASTSGFTATTDFSSKTGKHLAIIDLADDTTADFWKAGSEYLVAIDAVTVDAVTTGGWIARFRIGYPDALLNTSIATLASQTSFTLTTGPAEDDALNGYRIIVHDKASAVQLTQAVIEDYTGSTKTVTLRALPATTFTIAAGDNVSVTMDHSKADVTHLLGTAWLTPGVAGTPDVNTKLLGGTGQTAKDVGSINLSSGKVLIQDSGTGIDQLSDFVSATGGVTVEALAAAVIAAAAIAADAITAAKIAAGAIDEATFAADTAKYQAKVWLDVDAGAGTPADRYVVIWYKNGQPVVAGITSPLIQVYKIADGADLIASTAMTEIASTQTFRYVATTTERITAGVGYIALVTATIGGSARTWYQPVSRDTA